ncbi:MAG: DUF362 domain-containing protein [Negativicutes bacterium]|nr:DUF362 domain-containing protein [Negativicutes bacterium]
MIEKTEMNRRQFLWTIGSLSAMAAVGGVNLFDGGKRVFADPKKTVVSAAWMPKDETSYPLFTSMIEKATDFSWLKKGDSVLVKLALNSGNPNPATSDPWSLDCLLKVLKTHGAGKIYVGDQSGVRNVFWTAAGQQRGSSRAFAKSAGLLDVIEENGALPVFFEERGYDSYIETFPVGKHHWKNPLRITSFVNEVDHIVYLPRVGSHGFADLTSGMKIGVGFLREDSRREFHQGGADYYAMYEEINEVPEIKSRLRLTVSVGRKVMTLIGPDAGYILEPYSAPLFASENLMAHEIFAYAYLQYCREYLTPKDASDPVIGGNLWDIQKMRTVRNRGFLKYVWGLTDDQVPELPVFQPGDIYKHPAIMNYIRLNQQENLQFAVTEVNQNSDPIARKYLPSQLKV